MSMLKSVIFKTNRNYLLPTQPKSRSCLPTNTKVETTHILLKQTKELNIYFNSNLQFLEQTVTKGCIIFTLPGYAIPTNHA